jgi:phage terminase large subunit
MSMKLTFDTRGNEKQKECARAWVDPTITDIVYGGAKGGAKSWTGVSLIFGDAFIYPETMYFIARKKLNDLRKFTLPTIFEVFKDWGLTDKYYKYNGQDNYFQLYNKSRVMMLEAAPMPSDPLYMRFGSMTNTRGWIEEAGEFEEAAKNNLVASIGRWKNDIYNLSPKVLQTCNPSKNYLYREYFRKHQEGKLEEWKAFIQAFPQDNKMLPAGYVENLLRTLSRNEIERLIKGNWQYDDDPSVLMDYDKIVDLFSNTHVAGGRKCITVDAARFGGDKIVIMEWDGWRAKVRVFQKQGLDVTAQKIEESRLNLGCGKSDILVDEDGVGGGIVDFYKCKGFVNNSSPLPSPDSPRNEKGDLVKENFDNLKSQCYFRLAKRVQDNGAYIDCDDPAIRQMIIEELEVIKQKNMDSDMKRGVIPKEDMKELLGRSPDFADTLMMREYFELIPKATWVAF